MGQCGSSKKASSYCRDDKEAAGRAATHEPKSPALEILKERFARGEIDTAESEERRKVIAEA